MDIRFFIKFRLYPERIRFGTYITDCGARRLLHHIAKLACQFNSSCARHDIDLNGQRIAAYTCPRQPAYYANLILFFHLVIVEFLLSKIGLQICRRNDDAALFIRNNGFCRLPADACKLALHVAYAGLTCVMLDDFRDGLVLDEKLARL